MNRFSPLKNHVRKGFNLFELLSVKKGPSSAAHVGVCVSRSEWQGNDSFYRIVESSLKPSARGNTIHGAVRGVFVWRGVEQGDGKPTPIRGGLKRSWRIVEDQGSK
jgi:hypothetical protein